MASKTDKTRQYLAVDDDEAVSVSHGGKSAELQRRSMERTPSTSIQAGKEDLKEAAEQSSTVILELNLDGNVRWVSPSWEDVIGTPRESVMNKPISEILLYDRDAFKGAVETMKGDDSRSSMLRFAVNSGSLSKISNDALQNVDGGNFQMDEIDSQDRILNLEAQGILIYDRATGEPSHTMWVLRPSVQRNVIILELPSDLVESLGVGATMLAQYLTSLAEQGVADPENHPPPMPVLCRICERQIQPWWFEKHSELCFLEHQAESEVQMAQDNLVVHRQAIVKILDALERHHCRHLSGDVNATPTYAVEYRGCPIGPPSTSSSPGTASPCATPSRSRDSSASGGRPRSFIQRRPQMRIVELLLDLCDTALEISTPAIKEPHGAAELGTFRTQSPQSESRISQVQQWTSPSTNTLEQEQGLALLCADTEVVAKSKVEAVLRHARTIEYSERIRLEFSIRVQECIDEALQRAVEAASEVTAEDFNDCSEPEQVDEEGEPSLFAGEFDSNSLTKGFMGVSNSECSLGHMARSRRPSSPGPGGSGTNSPQECPTPKSQHSQRMVNQSRRNSRYSQRSSLLFDEGVDSDTSAISSFVAAMVHTDSPVSDQELTLARANSLREKRRSAYHTGSPRRQVSPARMLSSSSPLRVSKPRLQNLFGDMPSPHLSTGDFSPAFESFHHRRQSSATSSDMMASRPPLSPRLASVNPSQQRAVQPSIKDFEIIKPISKGAFGSVYLSKKKNTGEYYAIKVLKKADMIAKNQVTNVRAERAIMMVQGESDFVAKLFWTFQSKDYLYLVMEYLNGGDCAALIKQLGGLPEEWAKKYLAEVILGVEHLHNRGIVHRDLKPDNLLIDQKGHLKLTDFGLSRMGLLGRQRRAQTQSAESTPDLLKQGPFARSKSVNSSRSASFDFPGGSPSQTPFATPEQQPQLVAPSYFSLGRELTLSRENSRRTSNARSETGGSDSLSAMLNNFSLIDPPPVSTVRRTPMEEDARSESSSSSDFSALGLQHMSPQSSHSQLPQTQSQTSLPPPLALFDPEDNNRKFVGTPDYLAPETINGSGQDEMSDWWSLGCILFEFLFGYPPFHADIPEKVFENILNRQVDWPPEELEDEGEPLCSPEARDLINRLMCTDPSQRLGANGANEVKTHPWFKGVNWETLLQEEPSFVPTPQDPEDTDYFDSRGATLQSFVEELEDQSHSPNVLTPGADLPERPHDAVSGLRREANTPKRGLIPLHIPPHVREGRNRRLSEPVNQDDFGSFAFKNLPVLEKANKDVIQRLRSEALKAPAVTSSPSSPMDSSPVIPIKPLTRALSNSSKNPVKRPVSPSGLNQTSTTPACKTSQPSSPLMVSFTALQSDKHKPAGSSSAALAATGSSPNPVAASAPITIPAPFPAPAAMSVAIDAPRLATSFQTAPSSASTSPIKAKSTPITSYSSASTSPVRTHAKPLPVTSQPKTQTSQSRKSGPVSRARSLTVSSQESDQAAASALENWKKQQKRRSQVFDMSPSSSDNEESRTSALLRVQKRRQSSRRMSNISAADGPSFRPLDVLVCEEHPVSRMVMERMLEKLRCRTIAVENGAEAMRCVMGEVKFDIVFMEFKLPQISGEDVARMIRTSQNANSSTPIVAVTGYLKELMQPHYFDSLVEKPMTTERLIEVLGTFCLWRPPSPDRSYGERRDSLCLKKPEEDRAGSISPSVEKLMFKRGSSLGQVSSYTDDEEDTQLRKSPLSIPRSAKAEWDSLYGRNSVPTESTARKTTPKHLELPIPFTHSPPQISSKNIEKIPSKLSMQTSLEDSHSPLPIVPAMMPLPPPIADIPALNLSPERRFKRSSIEKKSSSGLDVEDADDELSMKKPSKSKSVSDFAAKIKRVSAEMKRSKSNISE